MRQAGTLEHEADARRFVDYLMTQGIEAKVDTAGDAWAIWIYDETHLSRGKEELAQFLLNPHDEKYRDVTREAASLRRAKEAAQRKAASNLIDARKQWQRSGSVERTPATLALLAICLLVAIITQLGSNMEPIRPYLYIARIDRDDDGRLSYLRGLQEVRHGEVWRLVTPIFIHMNGMHLLFNMIALWVFGRAIESRRGTLRFLFLVLFAAVVSNVSQYAYDGPELLFFGRPAFGGPNFGGMSGVNFALFGYCWVRTNWVRVEGPYIDSRTTFLIMIWFLLGFTGMAGPIANIAHAAGLLAGGAIGCVPLLLRR